MNELKPCPLCSGEANLTKIGNDHTAKRSVEIECTKCHFKRNIKAIRLSHAELVSLAIAGWNHRPLELAAKKQGMEEAASIVEAIRVKELQLVHPTQRELVSYLTGRITGEISTAANNLE